MTFVYPPRNLPGTAENWGRAVEARDNILSTDVTAQSQKLDNALRATGGQLAVMSSQIDSIVTQQATLLAQQATLQAQQGELLARASVTIPLSNLSVTTNPPPSTPGSSNWNSGDRTFNPPAPTPGARYVDISVSGGITGSNTGGSQPVAHLVLLNGTDTVDSLQQNVPAAGAAGYPPVWNTRFRLAADQLLPLTPNTFTLRLYVGAYFSGGSTTINLRGITATVRYGQLA